MGNLFPSWLLSGENMDLGSLFLSVLWKRGGKREKRIKWVKKKHNSLMLSSCQAEGAELISRPI